MNKKLLRKKLALMLANLKKKRKYYCEVEYIESSGTQYIDTGIIPSNNMEFRTKINFTSISSGDVSVISARVGGSNRTQPIFCYANKWTVAIGNTYDSNGASVSTNTYYDIKSVITEGKTITLYANGSQVATLTNTSGIANVPFYIFARNYGVFIDAYSSLKMNYMKIYSGGVLVRDFIPVLDWDMTPCMYDKVTEQLFYNAGTGDFVAGRQVHYVDYLESDGTQYIDTGLSAVTYGIPACDFKASFTKYSNLRYGILGYHNNGSRVAGIAQLADDSLSLGNYNRNVYVALMNTSLDFHEVSVDKTNGIFTVDGNSVSASNTNWSSSNEQNMLLYGVSTYDSTTVYCGSYKIKYFTIYNNTRTTVIRDYIPAIDENGVGFMFDRVSHTIYDNAGTGAFKYPARQVEYLEGTGTQYIDTGVRGFADFEIGVKLRKSVSNVTIFCSNNYRLERYRASNPYWRFRNNTDLYNSGVPITEYHVMAWKNDEVYSDGVKLQDFAKTWNVSANMTLFGSSGSGSYPSMIYFCKLWNPDNGTLLRDFVPAYKDGLVGLYDKVNDVLYQNIGSGNFLTGKIVEPEYE